jgi:hypothetical protein
MTLWFCLTQRVDYSQSLRRRAILWHISALLVLPFPGAQADRQAAEDSMKTAERVRTLIRVKLQLP